MATRSEPGLPAFRRGAERLLEAFNRGDMGAAWGRMPDDFEFHGVPEWPGSRLLTGPDEIIGYFRTEVRAMFPDWRGRIESITELGPGLYLNHLVMEGAGRGGGVPIASDLFQVWEMDGARPVRAREFLRRDEALAAAGAEDPETGTSGG